MITEDKFRQLYPRNKEPKSWSSAMAEAFPKYDINTPKRMAAFLAQCGHESAGWTVFEENLNYSAQGLVTIFKKYFPTLEVATPYARNPAAIANKVYASRMGNGDALSGDGYIYRGRGPIQLTGKDNYTRFAKDMLDDWENLVDDPDLVASDKVIALKSAIWFWNKNGLNKEADSGDIKAMTKKINGGFIGLADRIAHYEKALKLLEK